MIVNREKSNNLTHRLNSWAQKRILGLFIFNVLLMVLIVLRSAGYFDPFFLISINFIVFLSLFMSIFLLGVESRIMFMIGFILWLIAAFLRVVNIEVWAERTSIYTYQALILGTLLLIAENILSKIRRH